MNSLFIVSTRPLQRQFHARPSNQKPADTQRYSYDSLTPSSIACIILVCPLHVLSLNADFGSALIPTSDVRSVNAATPLSKRPDRQRESPIASPLTPATALNTSSLEEPVPPYSASPQEETGTVEPKQGRARTHTAIETSIPDPFQNLADSRPTGHETFSRDMFKSS